MFDTSQYFQIQLDYPRQIKSIQIFRRMSITHDLTKIERMKTREKVIEAKRMNDNDRTGKIKFIVRGPPWDPKVEKRKQKD